MSKTQDKRKMRNKERIEFLLERRKVQLAMFEQGVAVGLKLYEDNKDKLSPEEVKQLEEMRLENERLLGQVREQVSELEAELDALNTGTQA